MRLFLNHGEVILLNSVDLRSTAATLRFERFQACVRLWWKMSWFYWLLLILHQTYFSCQVFELLISLNESCGMRWNDLELVAVIQCLCNLCWRISSINMTHVFKTPSLIINDCWSLFSFWNSLLLWKRHWERGCYFWNNKTISEVPIETAYKLKGWVVITQCQIAIYDVLEYWRGCEIFGHRRGGRMLLGWVLFLIP